MSRARLKRWSKTSARVAFPRRRRSTSTRCLLRRSELETDTLGVIVADRNGEPFRLDEGELDLAQAMANVAALALEGTRTRQAAAVS